MAPDAFEMFVGIVFESELRLDWLAKDNLSEPFNKWIHDSLRYRREKSYLWDQASERFPFCSFGDPWPQVCKRRGKCSRPGMVTYCKSSLTGWGGVGIGERAGACPMRLWSRPSKLRRHVPCKVFGKLCPLLVGTVGLVGWFYQV